MKQSSILWLSAVIITLATGYIYKNSAPDFPVTGSERLEGKKIYYFLHTKYTDDNNYAVIIKSDLPALSGVVEWKMNSNSGEMETIPLTERDKLLTARLPKCGQNETITYRVILNRGNKTFALPASSFVNAQITGNVPFTLKLFFYVTIIVGFLLSARTGLEYFRNNSNAKRLSFFTLLFFFINSVILTPLKTAYEAGVNIIAGLPTKNLFALSTVLIFLGWVVTFILLYKKPELKKVTFFMAIISILLFVTVY